MSPFEMRPVVEPDPDGFPILHPFWVRTVAPLPDDAAVHACALTYMSDMGVVGSARAPTSTLPKMFIGASLDHAVWFHGPFRADDWLYYDQEGSWAGGGRAVCQGRMFDRGGRLVATVMQEGMVRRRRPPEDAPVSR